MPDQRFVKVPHSLNKVVYKKNQSMALLQNTGFSVFSQMFFSLVIPAFCRDLRLTSHLKRVHLKIPTIWIVGLIETPYKTPGFPEMCERVKPVFMKDQGFVGPSLSRVYKTHFVYTNE
jgi:hypothetical protein